MDGKRRVVKDAVVMVSVHTAQKLPPSSVSHVLPVAAQEGGKFRQVLPYLIHPGRQCAGVQQVCWLCWWPGCFGCGCGCGCWCVRAAGAGAGTSTRRQQWQTDATATAAALGRIGRSEGPGPCIRLGMYFYTRGAVARAGATCPTVVLDSPNFPLCLCLVSSSHWWTGGPLLSLFLLVPRSSPQPAHQTHHHELPRSRARRNILSSSSLRCYSLAHIHSARHEGWWPRSRMRNTLVFSPY